jgi:hypothetical protein
MSTSGVDDHGMDAEDSGDNSSEELPEVVVESFENLGLGEARKRRVTGLFVTINTQLPEKKLSIDQFKTYLETVLFTHSALPPLLGLTAKEVLEIDIQAPGIEVGERIKRVHCHFTLVCTHYGKVYLQGLQKRWQRFVTMTLPVHSYGVYCSIELLDYSAENYILKQQ